MPDSTDCKQNRDPLILVREGTSQEQRLARALDPAYAPVDERSVAYGMVFAQAYASFLKYFNSNNAADGDWKPFFSKDVSVQLAVAAVQDVEFYKATVKGFFDFLKDLSPASDETAAKDNLGYLFSSAGTLARQLDVLKQGLPADIPLKATLQNLIQSQLAPAFKRLLAYYKADLAILPESDRLIADLQPGMVVLGTATVPFSDVYQSGLSGDWITDGSTVWSAYTTAIVADASVYGSAAAIFQRINHIATHNLFTSIFDQLLKVYARMVSEGSRALQATLTGRDDHEPHYALFLAFLRLFDYARAEANTLTGRHLDFYYREVLRLKEKAAQPGQAHLLVELAKHAPAHLLKSGELFKAGKDDLGKDAFFANDRDFVANQAQVAELKTVYRHGAEKVGVTAPSDLQQGRIYASPVANSADGKGAELTSEDKSWHPLNNKKYQDGVLAGIDMPQAELGFAVASHYLLLAQGDRTVTVTLQGEPAASGDFKDDVICLLSSEKGWLEKSAASFMSETGGLRLEIKLSGADPAVVPYSAKTHGYNFSTDLPILLVKLKHRETAQYRYPSLEDAGITRIELTVDVKKLKSAALSNDFGPVDASKPFQPFGASPAKNSTLIIGSREMFQKKLTKAAVNVQWQSPPAPFGTPQVIQGILMMAPEPLFQMVAPQSLVIDELPAAELPAAADVLSQAPIASLGKKVEVVTEYLQAGIWRQYQDVAPKDVTQTSFTLFGAPQSSETPPYLDAPDTAENEPYQTSSRYGFVRLRLSDDFGQGSYEQALIDYIKRVTDTDPNNDGSKPVAPTGPFITELTLDYSAGQTITLDAADQAKFEARQASFFHLAPFGHAEQHPYLKSKLPGTADRALYLLPQLKHLNLDDPKLPKNLPVKHEAEFYVGVTELKPPQNLALLFQVADGTADPLSIKPDPHIQWSYLHDNEWLPFARHEVEDRTGQLLDSGIVTFAMPRDASDGNTLLPAGMHWIRGAVAKNSDSVCRLVMVAAQALRATFADQGNDPAFPARTLPAGTIAKLDQPDAEVKKIGQPFAGFGGRGKEAPTAFYTRVAERLRHKDRAIAQWDYERLVLEAFPQIYRAKCLNHTQYEPDQSGSGIYREMAPGHVTVVTIPNQQFQNLRDPLKPFTSLGLLEEIAGFLRRRLSCFVNLHVKNPQFEEVQVACRVRFHEGFDESFFKEKLKESVTRFLSPWAFPGGGSPSFGGKIHKSVLINFVEELSYVDCVTDFQLFHSFEDRYGTEITEEVDEVIGSKAVSVLVSSKKHVVETIKPAEEESSGEECRCQA